MTFRVGRERQIYVPDKNFEAETKKEHNVNNAIKLAETYINAEYPFHEEAALEWLCRAQEYANGQDLSENNDLYNLLKKFTKVYSIIFDPNIKKLTAEILKCNSIKKLELYRTPPNHYQNIEDFLRKSKTIKEVYLRHFRDPFTPSEIAPYIASGLSNNTSIQKLDLFGNWICDEGVIKILEAIESNPHSKITELNLCECGLGDKSAQKVLDVLEKKRNITHVNIFRNFISQELIEKINAIVLSRMQDIEIENIKDQTDFINFKDKKENTYLHSAASKGYKTVIEFLLSNGANVQAVNRKNNTPLHIALLTYGGIGDYLGTVKCLLDNGANIEAVNNKGETPLLIAINKFQDVDIIELLLQRGANINAKNDTATPLAKAKFLRRSDIIELLQKYGAKA